MSCINDKLKADSVILPWRFTDRSTQEHSSTDGLSMFIDIQTSYNLIEVRIFEVHKSVPVYCLYDCHDCVVFLGDP